MSNKLNEIVKFALKAGHCDWLTANDLWYAVEEREQYIKSLEDEIKVKEKQILELTGK